SSVAPRAEAPEHRCEVPLLRFVEVVGVHRVDHREETRERAASREDALEAFFASMIARELEQRRVVERPSGGDLGAQASEDGLLAYELLGVGDLRGVERGKLAEPFEHALAAPRSPVLEAHVFTLLR